MEVVVEVSEEVSSRGIKQQPPGVKREVTGRTMYAE